MFAMALSHSSELRIPSSGSMLWRESINVPQVARMFEA